MGIWPLLVKAYLRNVCIDYRDNVVWYCKFKRMQQIHEVIILGAGISGIGASKELTANGIEHIILESRDRVGGRICPQKFAGFVVDMGAKFIHKSAQSNLLTEFIETEGLTTKVEQNHEFYHEGRGAVMDDQLIRIKQLQQEVNAGILSQIQKSEGKCSMAEALQNFIKVELDGEEPAVRDVMLWKMTIENSIKGANLSEIDANVLMFNQRQNYMLVEGGFPAVFDKLHKHCKTQIRFNTRVLSVDYTGKYVRVHTTNGLYSCKRLISSLPLGVLKGNKVKFNPQIPPAHQEAIDSIAIGNQNRLLCRFTRPFWNIASGWLVFATRNNKNNRYPLAFVYPNNQGKHLLIVFVSGYSYSQIGEMNDQQIFQDFRRFLGRFVDLSTIEIEGARASRWHKDQHSLGSYCYKTKGTKDKHFKDMRKPIEHKMWFVGQHAHPSEMSYANGAYETGVWAGREVVQSLRGTDEPSLSVQL